MFTGLVRELGELTEDPTPSADGGMRLALGHSEALSQSLEIGSSLAVAGVCLTVVEQHAGISIVELSPETLSRTLLGELQRGSAVNLEPALRLGETLGGHWVQGHVDATIGVLECREMDAHREVRFELPAQYQAFVVEKGSATLDGVSLTVSVLAEDFFEVALIPHTLEVTTLGALSSGDRVHLEVDVLGKYVHRALSVSGVIQS